jgi:NAD(P)-dependent dehydrogenase (short-subunit alcohol dehydrogenase family)
VSRLENERPSLAAKLATAQAAQQDLAHQAGQFREGRILQLEARIAEIQSAIEAAGARREEAVAAVERATSLARTGNVSSVELNRLTREQAIAELAKHNPQGRLITPQEVADAVLWLCGERASAITGQAIVVAGGEV